jgi:hypothetical protein
MYKYLWSLIFILFFIILTVYVGVRRIYLKLDFFTCVEYYA